MNQYSHFAIEEADIIRPQAPVDPAEWWLLRRLRIPDRFNDPQGGTIKRALVIDVEASRSIEKAICADAEVSLADYEMSIT